MNRNILIALLIIVVLAVVGAFMFLHPQTTDGKLNTQINFVSGSTLKNGDQVQF